jgi:hypothetical protein
VNLPERIFYTGVPGSRWSGIAQLIEKTVPGFNISDRNEQRSFGHCVANPAMPAGHEGAYFGTGMEFEARFDDPKYIDSPWLLPGGCRIVKSHEWSLHLDKIKESYPEDWIMMVYRPDEVSSAWWHQIGGFTIQYPRYDHYVDSLGMNNSIRMQNKAILEFGKKHDAVWYTVGPKFFKEQFSVETDGLPDYFYDILITVIK